MALRSAGLCALAHLPHRFAREAVKTGLGRSGQFQLTGSLGPEPGLAIGYPPEPAVRERFAQQGLDVVDGTPEQFARLYREDHEKYGRLVKELNIRID